MLYTRRAMKAADLAAVDWILYRRDCNPWRKGTPVAKAYDRAFTLERRNNPRPALPPIPDLPRCRNPLGKIADE